MPRALLWNRLPCWDALPKHKKRQARVFALGAAVGIVAAVLAAGLPKAIVNWQDRRQQKQAMAPLVERARSLGLSYEAVLAAPAEHLEKPVVWCVDTVAVGRAYHSGRPSQPVIWENAADVPVNGPTTGGRCSTVLAVVMGVRHEGVVLRYLGLP